MNAAGLTNTAAQIEMVLFDVDGVFTDGRIWINHAGEETKSFNVRDGHGVRLLIHYGVDVAVLSGRQSRAVDARMRELGVSDVLQGRIDKRAAFAELIARKNLAAKQVAFVGDDIIDVPAMRACGLSFAVADAHQWTKDHADYTTQARGGFGAVREVCELILNAKGLLDKALNHNLS